MESKKMRQILQEYNIDGFDKRGGTDKNTIHSYIDAYESLLAPYIDKECTLLEIGVQYGGSSLLWHDYLPKARLSCIDNRPIYVHEDIKNFLNKGRYEFYDVDAYTDQCINLLLEKNPDGFDIILDDGPHTLESHLFLIKNYLKILKPNGIMIIEDLPINFATENPFGFHLIDENWIPSMIDAVPDELKNNVEVMDLTGIKGRYDDILFIIKK